MSEALVVNLFLTIRVLLVGTILLVLPRITRKGLLFGVYVGEEFSEGPEAGRLLKGWRIASLVVMAVSLLVGLAISFVGYPVPGNLTGTAILLLSGIGIYLRWNSKTRRLAPPGLERPANRATATLLVEKPRGELFARIALGVCALVCIGTGAYAVASFRSMPDMVPSIRKVFAVDGGLVQKSALSVLYAPGLNLLFSLSFASVAWAITAAKLSVREGAGEESVQAQLAFRATSGFLFSGMALWICSILATYSVMLIRIKLSQAPGFGFGIFVPMVLMILFSAGSLAWLATKHGQGGALRERTWDGSHLTGGLADNKQWAWGLFYINRDDPSWIIENRVGIGYTMNLGNPGVVLVYSLYVTLALLLLVLGFFL